MDAELRDQLADFFGCDEDDLTGQTLEAILSDVESQGTTIYWGSWTPEQLEEVY